MTLIPQSEFAKRKKVSRAAVTQWKSEGRLKMIGKLVDLEATEAAMIPNSRHRSKRRIPATSGVKQTTDRVKLTPPLNLTDHTVTPAKVTPIPALWHKLAPLCGDHLDGQDYGALTAAQRMAEAVPAVLALTAEAIGLTASQARQLQGQFRVSLMETAGLLLDTMAVPPPNGLASWCDAPMWDPSRFVSDAGGGA